MAELKPCPFCGCKDVYVMRDKEVIIERYIAVCGCCYAQIYRPYQQEAIEDWNKRAENEELEFTRSFINKHGLEFALASAWNRRAEDGK